METEKNRSKLPQFIEAPIDWHIPDDLVPHQATHMVVQHSQDTFFLSFFQTWPPMVVGSPEEIDRQIRKIKSVRAKCVARISITAKSMPNFIKALQTNYESSLNDPQEEEDNEQHTDAS